MIRAGKHSSFGRLRAEEAGPGPLLREPRGAQYCGQIRPPSGRTGCRSLSTGLVLDDSPESSEDPLTRPERWILGRRWGRSNPTGSSWPQSQSPTSWRVDARAKKGAHCFRESFLYDDQYSPAKRSGIPAARLTTSGGRLSCVRCL